MSGRKSGVIPTTHPKNKDSKIQDAAGVTKVDVEETAAEKIVRMDVNSVEAFKLNSDGILDLAKQSGIRAYKSASSQAIVTATLTKVVLDAETFDTQNEFDSTTNYRFTATKAGYYLVVGALLYVSPVDATVYGAYIYKNGSIAALIWLHSGSISHFSCFISDVIYLAVNDYIELWTRHTAGVNKDIYNDTTNTWMTIEKLS